MSRKNDICPQSGTRDSNSGRDVRCTAIGQAARLLVQTIVQTAPEHSNRTQYAHKAVEEATFWAESAVRDWRPSRMVEAGVFLCDDATDLS